MDGLEKDPKTEERVRRVMGRIEERLRKALVEDPDRFTTLKSMWIGWAT